MPQWRGNGVAVSRQSATTYELRATIFELRGTGLQRGYNIAIPLGLRGHGAGMVWDVRGNGVLMAWQWRGNRVDISWQARGNNVAIVEQLTVTIVHNSWPLRCELCRGGRRAVKKSNGWRVG